MKEVTKRNDIRWVKITHVGYNKYAVAFGFNGNVKAFKVLSGPKTWMEVSVENWMNDRG